MTAHLDHQVRLPASSGVAPIEFRCPYPIESTECGLVVENPSHDPDACATYDEGDDGCSETSSGWRAAPGCAVKGIATSWGLAEMELFTVDVASLPREQWFPVAVIWEGHLDDSRPVLRPVVTKSGTVMTEADFEALAKEAEVGYDVSSGELRRPRVVDVRGIYEITGRGTMTQAVEPDPPFRMDELVTVAGAPFYVKAIERHPVAGGPRPGLNVGLLLQMPDWAEDRDTAC